MTNFSLMNEKYGSHRCKTKQQTIPVKSHIKQRTAQAQLKDSGTGARVIDLAAYWTTDAIESSQLNAGLLTRGRSLR